MSIESSFDNASASHDPARHAPSHGISHHRLEAKYTPSLAPDAPLAVFLHGFDSWSRSWSKLVAEMREQVNCLTLDLPGFGSSPPPHDGDLSLTGHMRAVVDYLESNGTGPVHLVGCSLGAAIAVRLAAQRPDLVRTLTLISPVLPEPLPQPAALKVSLLALPGVARLQARYTARRGMEQELSALVGMLYGDRSLMTVEEWEGELAERRRRHELPYVIDVRVGTLRGIIRSYLERGEASLWQQARRVTAPTLLVYGRRDRFVSYRSAYRAERAFPDARLLLLPNAGHVSMKEFPKQVAEAFYGLLAADGTATGARPTHPAQP
ncbi:alpha/beta hydrolase [Streptosporangium sp. NPDC048865]|uniref:alpha/beta fold hydrolase n=1 Tax=Streptosporangium sp. NPDC048865 TaxID=3155766 RepID=UPI003433831B